MKSLLSSLFLCLCLIQGAVFAQAITTEEALAIIAKMELDPTYSGFESDQVKVFDWLQQSQDIYIKISDERINEIHNQKHKYSQRLYFLMLCGMARYDVQHKGEDIQNHGPDIQAGYDCMCNGYNALLAKHVDHKHKVYEKICHPKPKKKKKK